MMRFRSGILLLAFALLAVAPAAADTFNGSFRFGKVRFEPVDGIAYQTDSERTPVLSNVEVLRRRHRRRGHNRQTAVDSLDEFESRGYAEATLHAMAQFAAIWHNTTVRLTNASCTLGSVQVHS